MASDLEMQEAEDTIDRLNTRIAALEAQLAERQVKLLDPDMPAQQLRMHLGEMTAQELRTARAAIRFANSALSALEATPPAPKVTEEMVRALEGSIIAIDDWLHLYAPEECNPDRVAESRRRVNAGGTLWYIAITQERNRAALTAALSGDAS